jgi:spore maturation protein SpmA
VACVNVPTLATFNVNAESLAVCTVTSSVGLVPDTAVTVRVSVAAEYSPDGTAADVVVPDPCTWLATVTSSPTRY